MLHGNGDGSLNRTFDLLDEYIAGHAALIIPNVAPLAAGRHVEPDAEGYWWADMGPSCGPALGPYGSRTEALRAERE